MILFSITVLALVFGHYRGLAIFVPPAALFGTYHLAGFLNQQLLACPALPLFLLLLARRGRGPRPPDFLRDFTGLAGLTLLLFFFLLRPVIGPAADWDLFALPSLFYTPWLALGVARPGHGPAALRPVLAATAAVALTAVGPWVSLNLQERPALARFQELMEWEAGHNDYAASYGYYRLAKYLLYRRGAAGKEPALAALDRALEINSDSATLRKQAAEVLLSFGEAERAQAEMARHHRLRAEYYLRKENFEEAAKQYELALGFQPDSREILTALIELYAGPLAQPDKAQLYRAFRDQK